MTNRIKSVVAALLIGLMVFSFASCAGDTNEWAVKIGDETIQSGVYLGYLVNNYLAAQDKAGKAGDDLFKEKIDKKDAEQWILDETLEDCAVHAYVTKFFADEKLELNKDALSEINSETENAWAQYQLVYEKNGCSKASLKKIVTVNKKANLLFKHLYEGEGKRAVALKDQKDYFHKNYAKMKNLVESLTDPATNQKLSQDKIDNIAKQFKALTTKLINGEKFDELADKYNADKKKAADSSSKPVSSSSSEASSAEVSSVEASSKEDVSKEESSVDPARYEAIVNKNNSYYPKEVIDRLFDEKMKVDDPAFVETANYLFLIQKMELTDDGKDFKDLQSEIIRAMKGDDFQKELEENGMKLEIVKNEAAIKRFSPKNVPNRFLEASEPQVPGYPA